MLDTPDSGEYWFDGQNVAAWSEARLSELRRGRIGFIFQSFNLIEDLSVEENVELALEYTNVPAAERRERVAQMLDKLGVAHRARASPFAAVRGATAAGRYRARPGQQACRAAG